MRAPTVEHVVVLKRRGDAACAGAHLSWGDFLAHGAGQERRLRRDGSQRAGVHPRDLRHDGATPKLAIHTHGGYQVHIHAWASGSSG